jgi:hypothetical protein
MARMCRPISTPFSVDAILATPIDEASKAVGLERWCGCRRNAVEKLGDPGAKRALVTGALCKMAIVFRIHSL